REVHDDEVLVGILLCRRRRGVAEQEPDCYDQIALPDVRPDVRGVVLRGLRLDVVRLDAEAGLGIGEALVCGGVEALVVDATRVGDFATRHPDAGFGRAGRARALLAALG